MSTVYADVGVALWGGILGCKWHTIPTFGLTDNIKFPASKPINHGRAERRTKRHNFAGNFTLDTTIDLSKYGKIIALFGNNVRFGFYPIEMPLSLQDVIQLSIKLKDESHNPLTCEVAEFKIVK